MTPETVLTVGRSALQLGLLVASPLLLTALVVGIVVGLLQAATQVQEAALPFVVKLIAVSAMLALTGGWMLRLLVEFTRQIISGIPQMLG
jgi:flagellar biosynthesis protein FliQ